MNANVERVREIAAAKANHRPAGVYLLHARDTPHYKVGRSSCVLSRVAHIEQHTPFRIDLLFFVPARDAVLLERSLLLGLRKWRTRGEWFCLDSDEDVARAKVIIDDVLGMRMRFDDASTRRYYPWRTSLVESPAAKAAGEAALVTGQGSPTRTRRRRPSTPDLRRHQQNNRSGAKSV